MNILKANLYPGTGGGELTQERSLPAGTLASSDWRGICGTYQPICVSFKGRHWFLIPPFMTIVAHQDNRVDNLEKVKTHNWLNDAHNYPVDPVAFSETYSSLGLKFMSKERQKSYSISSGYLIEEPLQIPP